MHGRIFFAVIAVSLLALSGQAEEKSFESNGVKISYLDHGKGEAVVLLHGFGGSAADLPAKMPLAKALIGPESATHYRVLIPDLRGHGKSDKPHDPAKYGAELTEDVIRMLDHLKIKKAHVVGYSFGSSVAGKVLAAHPERLVSVTFGGGGPRFKPPKAYTDTIEATAASLEKGEGIGPLIMALAPEGQAKPTPERAAMISKLVLGNKDQKALAALLRGHSGLEVTEVQLKAVKVPVLFVYGGRDALMKDLVAPSREVLSAAKVEVVDKGDHMSTAASQELQTVVLDFLKKNRE